MKRVEMQRFGANVYSRQAVLLKLPIRREPIVGSTITELMELASGVEVTIVATVP